MDKQRINALLEEHLFERKPDPHRPGLFLDGKYSSPARNLLSWAGIWLVRDAMKKRGFVEFELSDRGWPEGTWCATFRTAATANKRRWDSMRDADEAPVAVALSALKALGVEV